MTFESVGPNQGFVKPTTRPTLRIPSAPMGKPKTRRQKVASALRKVIAQNVYTRAKEVFPQAKNLPVAIAEASKTAKVNPLIKSTVQRIMDAQTSATLEQLDGLAEALGLIPYQLLIPNLDHKNPQIAKGAAAGERDLYQRLERVEQALAKSGSPDVSKQ